MTDHNISFGIQIVPLAGNKPAYDLVDKAIEVIQNSGVKHLITPFETVMEGRYDELMRLSDQAQRAVLDAGADECLVYYRIHYRQGADVSFEEKRLDR